MGNIIQLGLTIPEADISTPTETRKYPLGLEITVQDSSSTTGSLNGTQKYKYIRAAGAALTINQPYVVELDNANVWKAGSPVTLAAPGALVGIPQVAFTSGYYGFIQTEGECEGLHIAETYAAGDHLQLLSAGTALVVDGSTGSTVQTVNTCAITVDAGTTAVAGTIILLGARAVVAAT